MALKNIESRKARAKALMIKTIYQGKSAKQAGAELGISHDTVTRDLQWAEDAKIFVEYEQRLLTELLPLAHQAAKTALEDGDATVAVKIMEMAQKRVDKSQEFKGSEDGGLYGEIKRLREGRVIDVSPTSNNWDPVPQPSNEILVPARDESRAVSDGVYVGGIYWDETIAEDEGETGSEDAQSAVESHED